MADLSQLPLEELMRLRDQMAPAPVDAPQGPPMPVQAAPDIGAMPLDQLMALRDQMKTAQPTQAEQPWYSKLGGAADDMARIVANAATFGMTDRLAGVMEGTGTEAERARTEGARQRAGSAAVAGDIIGTLAPASVLAKGVGAALPALEGASGALGLAGRTGSQVAQGAALGAADAAGNDRDIGRGAMFGAAAGGVGNVVGEGIAKGVGKVAGAFNKAPSVLTNPELRAAADAAYKRADDAGVIFTPQGVQRAQSTIHGELANLGFLPANQPKVAAVLGELEKASTNNNTLKGLDQVRRMAGGAFDPTNDASNKMLGKIVKGIDDLVERPAAGEVIAQDAKAGASAISEARDYWSRLRKSEALGEAVAKAERRAASTGSGGNSDNAIRQNVRGILDSKSKSRGYSPDELAAAESVVRGSTGQNAARLAGKLSPVGNGLMAALGLGATAANPMLAAIPAVGMAAKYVADKATPNKVEMLSRIIRAGGDKSAVTAAPNTVQRLTETKRDALVRLLMSGGLVTAR